MPLKLTPDFPVSLDTILTLLTAVNSKETQLNGALAADANGNNGQPTIIDVVATAGFPTQGLILIDAEVISYTGVTATSFTGITRAQDGTASAIHVTLTLVKNGGIALYHNILALMGIELEKYHITGNWLLLQAAAGVRISGTVFTITGDWTSRVQAGDKIKLTDTAVKYARILITPTFGAGVTTITLATSILVGNPSLIYYSKVESPQGFPEKAYGGAYSQNVTTALTVINTWYLVNLSNSVNLKNMSFAADVLTVAVGGLYRATYYIMGKPAGVGIVFGGKLEINAAGEVEGSYHQSTTPANSGDGFSHTPPPFRLAAGDTVGIYAWANALGAIIGAFAAGPAPGYNYNEACLFLEKIDD